MNPRDYIRTGKVELYALGSLEGAEKKEFEQFLLLYPEIQTELQKVEAVLAEYGQSSPRNPRPALRLKMIQLFSREVKKTIIPTPVVQPPEEPQSFTYKYLIAASLAALVVSTFASWFFYSRWNEAEDRYTDLLTEKNTLAMSFNQVRNQFEKTYSDLMIVHDENVRVITLTAADSTKRLRARIYWNPYTREVNVDALNLPEPDSGKHYQLWAITAGKATDAGLISASTDETMFRARNINAADAWWITQETENGIAEPSPDHILLLSPNK